MKLSLLNGIDKLRAGAEFVRVDEHALASVAESLAREELPVPNWRIPNVLPECDDETFIQYVGVVTSVNFAFTDFAPPHREFEIEWKGQNFKGSIALGACFMRALEEGVPILSPYYLKKLDMGDMRYIFRAQTPLPLMERRLEILRDAGQLLIERYQGRFMRLFEAADFRAFGNPSEGRYGVVDALVSFFTGFDDYAATKHGVHLFLKKAQLCCYMYQGRAINSYGVLPLLKDADELGPLADYRVPLALKCKGILRYEPSLEARVARQEIISARSMAEVEIRGQAVWAMARLFEEINKRRGQNRISMLNLDYKMWMLGRVQQEPHHLTPTMFY